MQGLHCLKHVVVGFTMPQVCWRLVWCAMFKKYFSVVYEEPLTGNPRSSRGVMSGTPSYVGEIKTIPRGGAYALLAHGIKSLLYGNPCVLLYLTVFNTWWCRVAGVWMMMV